VSFDLPQGWAWVRLRDLGTFTGGHTPSTSNRDLWGDEVLWVTSKDMKSKYINDTILKLTQLGAAELTMLKPNSIIMCTRSGILRRTFPVAIATQHLTINQDQRALTLYIPEMAEYIYDVLKAFESVILAHYKKAGTTVESIIWNKFTEIPIPMPPLPEQRRIIAKIEELFAIADSLGVAVDGLENAAKRLDKKILDLAIRGKLVPQDPDDEPASELVKRIATSHKSPCKNQSEPIHPPFEIPGSWEWVMLGTITNYGQCKSIDAKAISPDTWSLDLEEIEKDTGRLLARRTAAEKKSSSSKHIFCRGMVLYSKLRTYLNKVLVADMDGVCTSEIVPISVFDEVIPEYLCLVLTSQYFLQYTAARGYGVKMPRVGTNDMRSALIPLPPSNEQKRIVKRVEELKATTRTLVTF